MPEVKVNLMHPEVKVHSLDGNDPVIIRAEFIGSVQCLRCEGRKLRHESIGTRNTWLYLTLRKYQCLKCGRYFRGEVVHCLSNRSRRIHKSPPTPSLCSGLRRDSLRSSYLRREGWWSISDCLFPNTSCLRDFTQCTTFWNITGTVCSSTISQYFYISIYQ